MTSIFSNRIKKEKEEKIESFMDIHGDTFANLYFSLKDYIQENALDLLNDESSSSCVDFVEMIFNSVHYEIPQIEDNNDDELVDLQN